MFWFFGLDACGNLAAWPGTKPAPHTLEGEVLTLDHPRSSHMSFLCFFFKMSTPSQRPLSTPPREHPRHHMGMSHAHDQTNPWCGERYDHKWLEPIKHHPITPCSFLGRTQEAGERRTATCLSTGNNCVCHGWVPFYRWGPEREGAFLQSVAFLHQELVAVRGECNSDSWTNCFITSCWFRPGWSQVWNYKSDSLWKYFFSRVTVSPWSSWDMILQH